MKKIISCLIIGTLLLLLVACGSSPNVKETTSAKDASTSSSSVASANMPTANEEDLIDDEGWDDLEKLGKIETENGLFITKITLPAEFMKGVTQEELDSAAGEAYISAKINSDGSVRIPTHRP